MEVVDVEEVQEEGREGGRRRGSEDGGGRGRRGREDGVADKLLNNWVTPRT